MHCKLEDLPVFMEAPGTKVLMQPGWGGMTVAFWQMPGADSKPMFKGSPIDSCSSPHWGYMIKGSMQITYDDGAEETINAGDVFHLPAGHNGKSDKELVWIEFSPDKELKTVLDHMAEIMKGSGQ